MNNNNSRKLSGIDPLPVHLNKNPKIFTQDIQKKIAIIGAGASGLTSAWLLQNDYDVTLFEQQPRLGGHANTIYIPTAQGTVPLDLGFEFFSDSMFHYYKKLLALLNVPVRKYPATYTFYSTDHKNVISLPLIKNNKIVWESLKPSNLLSLMQFGYFVHKGTKVITSGDTSVTFDQFANSLPLTESFKNNFLYPVLSGGWGVQVPEFKHFSAYDLLTWAVKNKISGFAASYWNEVDGGTSVYIDTLSKALHHTTIKTSSTIIDIQPVNDHYKIILSDGSSYLYDHLIFTTNAKDALPLLQHIPHTQDVQAILARFKYFSATIAIHGDRRFMPKDQTKWAVTNVRYTPERGMLTIYKPRNQGDLIFKSWISEEDKKQLPSPLYALENYYHAKVTPEHFQAQKELSAYQGAKNIWFGGLYTHDVDSHESCIISAMNITRKLAPKSTNLQLLENE